MYIVLVVCWGYVRLQSTSKQCLTL